MSSFSHSVMLMFPSRFLNTRSTFILVILIFFFANLIISDISESVLLNLSLSYGSYFSVLCLLNFFQLY